MSMYYVGIFRKELEDKSQCFLLKPIIVCKVAVFKTKWQTELWFCIKAVNVCYNFDSFKTEWKTNICFCIKTINIYFPAWCLQDERQNCVFFLLNLLISVIMLTSLRQNDRENLVYYIKTDNICRVGVFRLEWKTEQFLF